MSRQFRLYLLPDDVEWLIAELRTRFEIRLLQGFSESATVVEIDSPLRSWPANPRQAAHVTVSGYLAPSSADIRLWYAPKRSQWLIAEESEVVEFSGCDFDGTTLGDGRFYFQTDRLAGDVIIPKRPTFLTWADRIFRVTKKILVRSTALNAYLGPRAGDWLKNGGRVLSFAGRPATRGEEPGV